MDNMLRLAVPVRINMTGHEESIFNQSIYATMVSQLFKWLITSQTILLQGNDIKNADGMSNTHYNV